MATNLVAYKQRRGMTAEEKFMRFVMPEPNSGCWLWVGAAKASGHGKIRIDKKYLQAHRVFYVLFNKKEIPEGMVVRHKCDVSCCVNPLHLEIGTQADNLKDMHDRNRNKQPFGERHSSAKLKTSDVVEIKMAFINGTSVADLMKKYNISSGALRGIKNGKKWKSVQLS